MGLLSSKVTPGHQQESQESFVNEEYDEKDENEAAKIYVMLLQIFSNGTEG